MMLYAKPSFDAPFRGKIPRRERFAVFARIEGEDERCGGDGWARLGRAAYGCLEHTVPTDEDPDVLPHMEANRLVPFYYARLKRKRADGTNPPAPIWRSRRSLREDRPPIGELQPEHVYAFETRRRTRDGVLLFADGLGVVRENDVKPLEPRDFQGRDLLQSPVPDGMILAWSVSWPHVSVLGEPHPEAEPIGRIEYHEQLYVLGPSTRRRGVEFRRVASPVVGWIDASEIRRWIPMGPPADVEPDELWIDVELDQQTLTVVRGDRPQFVTLVSTGTWKDPTPPGLFRVETKEAFGDMRSREGDEDRYHVEAVPWVQYFHGRYGFHGAYWHNRFGRRTSHGCINLSPRDAARVFALTTPVPEPGWILVYEHAEEPGTLVRVRKLTERPPNRREPPKQRRARDYG